MWDQKRHPVKIAFETPQGVANAILYGIQLPFQSASSQIFRERNWIPHKFSFALLAQVEEKILREVVEGGVQNAAT